MDAGDNPDRPAGMGQQTPGHTNDSGASAENVTPTAAPAGTSACGELLPGVGRPDRGHITTVAANRAVIDDQEPQKLDDETVAPNIDRPIDKPGTN